MTKIDEMNPGDPHAALFGMLKACHDAVRALAMTHPEPEVLAEAMHREREETIAIMLANGSPDLTINAYRDFIDAMRPHLEGDDLSPS